MKQQYINGEWLNAVNGNTWDLMNPATEEIICKMPYGNDQDFQLAMEAAVPAFKEWKKTTPYFRGDILKKTADYIRANAKKFAEETILETGKPRNEAEGEWLVSANLFEWYAEEGKRSYGRVIPTNRTDKRSQVIFQPLGVVGVITAWNFPAYNPARAVAAALAAGCSVILKGSEFTPMSACNIAKALHESGLPKGVFNLINGESDKIGNAMLEHPELSKISFTGSTRVGEILMNGASKTHTKLSLELGGNAPVIIEDDVDVKEIAKQAVIAKLRNCGQVCVAPQRFYINQNIYQDFISEATNTLRTIKTGLNTGNELLLGPLINQKQQNHILGLVEKAKNEGANITIGGEKSEKGFFLEPILLEAKQEHSFIKEETFGPILIAIPFETKEQALEWANDTEYGLASYVFTESLKKANYYAENLEFGMVGVNEWAAHGTEVPFVGIKSSGLGHESGAEGLKEYLEMKLISYGGM